MKSLSGAPVRPKLLTCLTWLAIVSSLTLATPARAQPPGLQPKAAPVYPATPPPAIGVMRPPDGTGYRIPLHAGWNMVSFPFAQVQSVRGLQYDLLRPRGSSSSIVDPVSQTREIDTHFGYWAYAKQDSTLEVTGAGALADGVDLEPGWNLVGCPNPNPLAVTQLVSPDSSKALAFEKTFGGVNGVVEPQPMLPGTTFQPGGCYWVYAYLPGRVNWQPAPPPAAAPAGPGPVLPTAVGAGVGAGLPKATPFVGQVTNNQAIPVYRARVVVVSSAGTFTALTDKQGRFTVPAVPPGPAQIIITAKNFETVQQPLSVVRGAVVPLRVPLRRQFCVLAAYMYTYDYGKSHYKPVKIWMWETNNYAHRYFNTYSRHIDSYRTDAYFKPFPLGVDYTIEVTWCDQFGNEQYITRYGTTNKPRTDTYFYNSWSYWP